MKIERISTPTSQDEQNGAGKQAGPSRYGVSVRSGAQEMTKRGSSRA